MTWQVILDSSIPHPIARNLEPGPVGLPRPWRPAHGGSLAVAGRSGARGGTRREAAGHAHSGARCQEAGGETLGPPGRTPQHATNEGSGQETNDAKGHPPDGSPNRVP